jgi:adenine deaminase
MLEATAGLPLRVYIQAPSCVPAVPGHETAGAEFGAQEMAEMLSWERVIGVAEVMDYVGVVQQSPRMRDILGAAMERGTVISGHCPEVHGRDLAAYLMAGPASDHEAKDAEEWLEKLRLGMTVEAKVSSFSESISAIGPLVRRLGHAPPNLVFCTDDIWPDDLLSNGHMDNVLQHAIAAGFAPLDAIRAATLHGARRNRLFELGAIAPGKWADILLVPDPSRFEVDEVFVAGSLVARQGRMLIELPAGPSDVERENTVLLASLPVRDDFTLRARAGRQQERLRVIVMEASGFRSLETVELPVREGLVDLSGREDLCWVAVLERHGRTENRSLSVARDMGLRSGAVASTVAHDSHNLVVVGRDAEDMVIAAGELTHCGGGICCASRGQATALLPLPIAGLMSPLPLSQLVHSMKSLNGALVKLGFPAHQPLRNVLGVALPVIPHYGVTDKGLIDVDRQVVLPIWADEE